MPKVTSAEEASEVAERFLGKYHRFFKLLRVYREEDQWMVEADVGFFMVEIAKITIDATDGKVIDYQAPTL